MQTSTSCVTASTPFIIINHVGYLDTRSVNKQCAHDHLREWAKFFSPTSGFGLTKFIYVKVRNPLIYSNYKKLRIICLLSYSGYNDLNSILQDEVILLYISTVKYELKNTRIFIHPLFRSITKWIARCKVNFYRLLNPYIRLVYNCTIGVIATYLFSLALYKYKYTIRCKIMFTNFAVLFLTEQ